MAVLEVPAADATVIVLTAKVTVVAVLATVVTAGGCGYNGYGGTHH